MKKSNEGVLTPQMLQEACFRAINAPLYKYTVMLSPKEYALYKRIKEIEPDFEPTCGSEVYFKADRLNIRASDTY